MGTEIKTQYTDLECRILEIKAMAQELNEEGLFYLFDFAFLSLILDFVTLTDCF